MVAIAQTHETVHSGQTNADTDLSGLAHRLERGIQVIDSRRAAGLPTDAYEEHWLRLLDEYEALFDHLDHAGSTS